MRARLGPSQSSASQRRPLTRGAAADASARSRRDGVALELVEYLLWIAARLHGEADVLQDAELHAVPRRVGGRPQPRVGTGAEIRLERGVGAHALEAGLRHRQEALGRDPPGDVVRLVVEIEELLHRLAV